MSRTIAIMSMSLDGFVADPDDRVGDVFAWQFGSGDVEVPAGPMTMRMSPASADHWHALTDDLGALITGRRTFEVADGWGGHHPWGPAFVLSHDVPDGWPREGSSVSFVADGVESAVEQARTAAGGRAVAVHGADTICQLLDAGLLDEISLDVSARLLGDGVRLFDRLTSGVTLGDPTVVQGVGVTHLRYPVQHEPRRPDEHDLGV